MNPKSPQAENIEEELLTAVSGVPARRVEVFLRSGVWRVFQRLNLAVALENQSGTACALSPAGPCPVLRARTS